MNLWHDITIGKNAPEEFNCIIEISKGSHNKYEIDKETGLIKLDRANYGPLPYPFDYGFVPQTLWEDGDALDVILLSTFPIESGILVNVRPVALMQMMDCGESDDKIIAVPVEDRRWTDIQNLKDINKHSLREFKLFWEAHKKLKGDNPDDYPIEVLGFEEKDKAILSIKKSIELYNKKFGKK